MIFYSQLSLTDNRGFNIDTIRYNYKEITIVLYLTQISLFGQIIISKIPKGPLSELALNCISTKIYTNKSNQQILY